MKNGTIFCIFLLVGLLLFGCTATRDNGAQNQSGANGGNAAQTGAGGTGTANGAGANGAGAGGAGNVNGGAGANGAGTKATIPPGGNNGTLDVEDQNPLFFWGGWSNSEYDLPDYATVGMAYNYSFCEPSMSGPNELCGGTDQTTNPSGGDRPYRFVLDSGIGFMPLGLTMHPDGYVDGTPSAAGQSRFGVCAVDTTGRSFCDDNLTMTVVDPVTLTLTRTGSGEGFVILKSPAGWSDCGTLCSLKFHGPYFYSWATHGENKSDSADLNATAAPGSYFERWEGDACSEDAKGYTEGYSSRDGSNDSCNSIAMDRDRKVVAVFTKTSITMDTHSCPTLNNLYYGGTANGPVGSGLYVTNASRASKSYFTKTLDCGAWSKSKESDFLCVREKGQPESTTWNLYVENRLFPEVVAWKAALGMPYEGPLVETPVYSIECPAPPKNWQP